MPGRDRRPSEFGGVPGPIQPEPHDPANSTTETLMQIYATEPAPDRLGQPAEEFIPITTRKR